MVAADSRRVPRAPRYSGTRFESGSLSPTWLSHSMAPLSRGLRLATGLVTLLLRALQPRPHPKVLPVWAISDFARHYFRNHYCFLFLQVLRWFTSLGSLRPTYGFSGRLRGFTAQGFPIRKSPDQSLLAAPRGLSQLATSFIACFCQGIHHAPLVA
jgi:hypothetical protein